LHTDVTDLADEIYVFKCKGKNTLARLEADSTIPDDEDHWNVIRNLPKFHFLHWPSGQYLQMQPVGSGKSDRISEDRPEQN
jgi:hypothetical protein